MKAALVETRGAKATSRLHLSGAPYGKRQSIASVNSASVIQMIQRVYPAGAEGDPLDLIVSP